MNNKIKIIEQYAKSIIAHEPGHDFSHADRVRHWALKIARAEKYSDLIKIEAAALLHDVGRESSKNKGDHGRKGSQLARDFLTQKKLFSPADIEELCQVVLLHCERNNQPKELLKIIQDADMLDSLGMIGLLRAAQFYSTKEIFNPKNPKSKTWRFSNNKFQGFTDYRNVVDTFNYQISFQDNLKTKFAKKQAKHLVKIQREMIKELEKEVERCYN